MYDELVDELPLELRGIDVDFVIDEMAWEYFFHIWVTIGSSTSVITNGKDFYSLDVYENLLALNLSRPHSFIAIEEENYERNSPLLLVFSYANASFPYYGTKIGSLKRLHHGVSGDVYAVDSRTIFVKKFNYDGDAPDITLTLPEGKTLKDIKWFSVWCDEFAVNFGDVSIPSNLDFPRPQKINGLNGVHGVKSDNIVIVDAQTLLVPNFSYDGEAPDAKFWVGQGERPTPNGLRIPDENGKENPLRRYDRKTIVLTLPDDLTIFDIGHFGVWCEAFTVDFGHVLISKNLNVPPSLKMLGISPQVKKHISSILNDLIV
ncbi:hypothetical protein GQX74_010846 [Glossina fuscipes]|nr:hypothetical protein GQX74_010846 [Glossina fuscipes]